MRIPCITTSTVKDLALQQHQDWRFPWFAFFWWFGLRFDLMEMMIPPQDTRFRFISFSTIYYIAGWKEGRKAALRRTSTQVKKKNK